MDSRADIQRAVCCAPKVSTLLCARSSYAACCNANIGSECFLLAGASLAVPAPLVMLSTLAVSLLVLALSK